MKFSFDNTSIIIDGERKFLISGEFPYFRVSKSDWSRRLDLFIECGGNCVASYVPWLIHEPEEGKILFDDCNERDLTYFIKLVAKKGLMLVLRPGPYVYSELVNSGLPRWLVNDYPELLARDIDGKIFSRESVSYLHPLFLEKVEKWYAEFSLTIKPYLSTSGGPIISVQLDNELIGAQEWHGSIDYNAITMGFGAENGRYPTFLRKKYGDIAVLNKAYETRYNDFTEVYPKPEKAEGKAAARIGKDYHDFYCETIEEYAEVLANMLKADGIDVSLCHNAAGPTMIPLFKGLNKRMGDRFLLGVDNYYALDINWAQNNPTPQYFARVMFAADLLKSLGNPPVVFEMPGGSPSQLPPILRNDLYACYMANLAAGMRGVNYYIFTGGKNLPGTGITCDDYDYCAFVSSDGKVRDTYGALIDFHKTLHENEWLCGVERVSSVQIGTEWQTLRGNQYAAKAGAKNTLKAQFDMERCVTFSLLSGKYSGAYTIIEDKLDVAKPLIICSPDNMSEAAQRNVIDFVERGGKLLLLSTIPVTDNDFEPCTELRDFIGDVQFAENDSRDSVTLIGGRRVFRINCANKIVQLPVGAEVFATDSTGENVLGFKKRFGNGEIVYIGGTWLTTDFNQVAMLEDILAGFGAKPCVENSNRTVYATMFEDSDRACIFLINLYTGAQETEAKAYTKHGTVDLGKVELAPMEVKIIVL